MFRWTVQLNVVQYGYFDQNVAVAAGGNVYSFMCNRWNEIVVYVLNTASLSWNRLETRGPVLNNRFYSLATRRGYLILNKDHSRNWCFKAVLVEDVIYLLDLPLHMLYGFGVDNHTWSEPRTSGTVPEIDREYCACALGKVMFIYGERSHNNLHKLDTATNPMVWSLIETTGTPPGPSGHSPTIIGTKMFVFEICDLWLKKNKKYRIRVFDPETDRWLSSTSELLHLEGHHSDFVHNEELYYWESSMWQLNNLSLTFDDRLECDRSLKFHNLWKFDPESFSVKKVQTQGKSPPHTGKSRTCCCPVGDRVIFFDNEHLFILDLNPSLKTLCKLAVIHDGLDQSELPHNLRWELAAMDNEHHQMTRKAVPAVTTVTENSECICDGLVTTQGKEGHNTGQQP